MWYIIFQTSCDLIAVAQESLNFFVCLPLQHSMYQKRLQVILE